MEQLASREQSQKLVPEQPYGRNDDYYKRMYNIRSNHVFYDGNGIAHFPNENNKPKEPTPFPKPGERTDFYVPGNIQRSFQTEFEWPATYEEAIEFGYFSAPPRTVEDITNIINQGCLEYRENSRKDMTAKEFTENWVLRNWKSFMSKYEFEQKVLDNWERLFNENDPLQNWENLLREHILKPQYPSNPIIYFEEQKHERVRDLDRIHAKVSARVRKRFEERIFRRN